MTGNGTIVGVDNGNPSTVDKFQQKSVLTSDKTANIQGIQRKSTRYRTQHRRCRRFRTESRIRRPERGFCIVNTVGDKKGEVFLKDYKVKSEYTVTMGTKPQLQTAVTGIMSDDSTQEGTITWNLTGEMYNTPGEKELKGTLKVGNEEVAVSANLM